MVVRGGPPSNSQRAVTRGWLTVLERASQKDAETESGTAAEKLLAID
jgi:hypothetical protein